MSRLDPARGCLDVRFSRAYRLGEGAELALEDYARALAGAASAEAVSGGASGGAVSGVHLCGTSGDVAPAQAREIEDFARDLLARSGRGGLGWE